MSEHACAESKVSKVDNDGVPYDRGWAWVVLFGSCLNGFLLSGYDKSRGIFFDELLDYYQSTHSHTALLFAVKGVSFSTGGLFVMNVVVGRIGCRKTVLIGAAMMSLSAILSSVANQLTLLLCLQATLLGLGDVMVVSPAEVLVANYFRRRRYLALAITKCVSSLGTMVFPALVTYFLSVYGLKGAFLLTGGVCLHGFPAALLFRPTSFFSISKRRARHARKNLHRQEQLTKLVGLADGKRDTQSDSQETDTLFANGDGAMLSAVDLKDCVSKTNPDQSDRTCDDIKTEEGSFVLLTSTASESADGNGCDCVLHKNLCEDTGSPEVARAKESRTVTIDTHRYTITDPDNNPKVSLITGSELNEAGRAQTQEAGNAEPLLDRTSDARTQQTNPERSVSTRVQSALFCLTSVLDFSLFRHLLFRLLFVCFALFAFPGMALNCLPVLARENGISEARVAVLLSIVGGLDLLARFATGIIVDRKWLRMPTLIVITFVILGVTYHCVRFMMTSFFALALLAVPQGLLGGASDCLIPGLVVDFVGLDQMAKGIGFYHLAKGTFQATVYPLLGYIRDQTGSYVAVYHLIGSLGLLVAALLCLERPMSRSESRKAHALEVTLN